jgi:hypothetical protein
MNEAGKGDKPRPRQVSQEEYDLRWDYAMGKMDISEFNERLKEIRSGKKDR